MKKIKALLLLFLLSITSSLTINTKTVEAKASDDIVRRDEDIVLEYSDERSESSLEGTILTRHYTNITVGDITEIFKAINKTKVILAILFLFNMIITSFNSIYEIKPQGEGFHL